MWKEVIQLVLADFQNSGWSSFAKGDIIRGLLQKYSLYADRLYLLSLYFFFLNGFLKENRLHDNSSSQD
jgi:hypothetical protein